MRTEISAGGVVIKREDGKEKVLLCLQQKLSGKRTYCLPKGHVEKGETKEEAAIREVFEETGIRISNPRFIDKIDYFFVQEGERIKKTVYFYLMDYQSGSFTPNKETIDIGWFEKDEALSLTPYPSEKKIIEIAFQKLYNHSQ